MQEKTFVSLSLKISLWSMPLGADCVGLQLYHNLAMPLEEAHTGKDNIQFPLSLTMESQTFRKFV